MHPNLLDLSIVLYCFFFFFLFFIPFDLYSSSKFLVAGMLEGGRQGGRTPPQFLADQLTLSRPGGAHYPHPVLLAPPDFQTLRHAWTKVQTKQNVSRIY